MKKPTNTTERAEVSAFALATMIVGPSAVVLQEVRGQRELVESESLPTDGAQALVAIGVEVGAPFPDDAMFCPVKLPPGWSKRRTDHSMWSDLVDDKGRKRASIFYKAAFYDRAAHVRPCRRFTVDCRYDGRGNVVAVEIRDAGHALHVIPFAVANEGLGYAYYEAVRRVEAAAAEMLRALLPDCDDVSAYWTDIP